MDEIIRWSATETARKINDKSVSVTEVTQAHLARIKEVEPGLTAVVETFEDQSLATAAAKDQHGVQDAPLLHGLPITIKINVDFAGRPNSNGIPALNTTPAAQDSPIVAHYKAGGAIPIGRTNTPEFSLRWFTSNPIYGVTENPVNRALTPGGSSGGAAAAVAAGMGVLGHGNDLGGSLRYPAYCCGLATLKPSSGRVPAFNGSAPTERPMTLQMMSVQGTIARTVADVRLALRATEGRSSEDGFWNAAPNSGRVRQGALKVGVCVDPFGDGVAPEVAAAVSKAAAVLQDQGCEIIETTPPMAVEAALTWGALLNAETHVMSMDSMRPIASDKVLAVLDFYLHRYGMPDLKGFMEAQARRMSILRQWNRMFDQVDVLLMPVSCQPPFLLDQDFRQPETLADIAEAQRCLFLANLLGLPSAAVPTGANDGVPMGVQITGAWRDDDLCLEVAEMLETGLGLDTRPVAV